MKEEKTLYEFKHNFYLNLYAAMERKNMTYKELSHHRHVHGSAGKGRLKKPL